MQKISQFSKKGKKISFTILVMMMFFSSFFVNKVFAFSLIPTSLSYSISSSTGIVSCTSCGMGDFYASTTIFSDISESSQFYYAGGGSFDLNGYDMQFAYGTSSPRLFLAVNGSHEYWAFVYTTARGWERYDYYMDTTSHIELGSISATLANNPVSIWGNYTNADTYNRMQIRLYSDYSGSYIFYNYDITLQNGIFSFIKNIELPYISNYTVEARLYDTSSSTSYVYSDWSNTVSFALNDTSMQQGSTTAELNADFWQEKQNIYNITGNLATSSVVDNYNSATCNPFISSFPYFKTDFSPFDCVGYLMIPSERDQAMLVVDLSEGVKSAFPFNVVYGFYDIFATTSTTTLPSLSIPIPASMPGGNLVVELDIFNNLMGATSILGNATSTYLASTTATLSDIIMPYWIDFVWVLVGIYMLVRIFGLNMPSYFGNPNETLPYSRQYNNRFYDSKENLKNRALLDKFYKKWS